MRTRGALMAVLVLWMVGVCAPQALVAAGSYPKDHLLTRCGRP
jgi:hypothetical protein